LGLAAAVAALSVAVAGCGDPAGREPGPGPDTARPTSSAPAPEEDLTGPSPDEGLTTPRPDPATSAPPTGEESGEPEESDEPDEPAATGTADPAPDVGDVLDDPGLWCDLASEYLDEATRELCHSLLDE
jgi:hypothetical protein